MKPELMTLTQWLSPSFPIGSFVYSHGLEAAVADGLVTPETLYDWLADILLQGTGRTDAIWLRLAFASDDLEDLNDRARAFQTAKHRLREAEKQGAIFIQTVNQVWGGDLPPLLMPLAVGAAAKRHGIDVEDALPLYLQSFTGNLVSAAQRLMPLGQTKGQRILTRLHPVFQDIAKDTAGATMDDIHSTAFLSDIMAMRHETLEPRLFQS